jgi:catechol 2,3-dioxygenase
MSFHPQFGDVAHLGHVELLAPNFVESTKFFANVLGLAETYRTERSVYFRAWGDYESCTLKITESNRAGLGHIGMRVRSERVLDELVRALKGFGVRGEWLEGDLHHGPAFRFPEPDGHLIELYFETTKFKAPEELTTSYKNVPQRRPSAITPLRLDHVNILSSDVRASREFFQSSLGMKLTEQIIFDDGREMGAWLTSTQKSYDLAITRDSTGTPGRLHHLTYFMETREDVLKMADILRESGTFIETGPHKHSIGQTFFLYFYEPGGNRVEVASGGFTIFDPDWDPIVWTEQERKTGQAWGLQTIPSFHTYGTPVVEGSGEPVLQERPKSPVR